MHGPRSPRYERSRARPRYLRLLGSLLICRIAGGLCCRTDRWHNTVQARWLGVSKPEISAQETTSMLHTGLCISRRA
ncbi:hypothetical protein DFH11DRAFT_1583429 [Phellopilus nigrolimitatus]|nr:hypothetical protein DFH11DRAFT_1583429 [Phellopilus nigrolimitatus]